MRKLLRPQDILLLGLANVLDLFEEARDPLGIVGKSYEIMYGWIPTRYKRNNFNHLVWRNLKTGYIEKAIKDGMPYLRLTTVGKNKIERDFPLLTNKRKKWDRKWRLVVFDIEEISRKTRERFRYKLKEVGFGMLQESVFISPYDIARDFAEFIDSQGLADSAYVLEVSNIVIGDIKAFANKIWKLEDLNKKYKSILQEIEYNDLILISDQRPKLNGEEGEKRFKDIISKVWQEYLGVLLKDPFLPKELLPLDWEGERARAVMRKLRGVWRWII